MHDTARVRLRQRRGDLLAEPQKLFHRQWALAQAAGECLAFEQLHHEVIGPDVVKRADMWMVQSGDRGRLPFETCAKSLVNELDRHRAAEASVASPVNPAHTPGPKQALDPIRPELRNRIGLRNRRFRERFRRPRSGGDSLREKSLYVKAQLLVGATCLRYKLVPPIRIKLEGGMKQL